MSNFSGQDRDGVVFQVQMRQALDLANLCWDPLQTIVVQLKRGELGELANGRRDDL